MTQTTEAAISLGEKGLTLPVSNRSAYFNYYWLRDNDPTSFNADTRERSFDIFHLAEAPVAKSASVEGDALVIDWANEDHITRMPLAWLDAYADGTRRPDPADLPRRPWYGDHYPNVARFTHTEVMSDPTKRRAWLEAMIVEGLAVIKDMPDSDEGLTELARVMGQVRPTFFGDYFDVKTHINPTNTAYTASALELHTDTPAEEHAPGIQLLHMRANTVEGGRNLFGDGVAAANDYREIDPEGFRLLAETDVPFFCEHDDYDMRSWQRIIELDQHGEVSGLTFSQHMLDLMDLPQEFLDDWYPAFCRFGKLLQDDKYIMRFTLQAGECIVFDNHRIVHGRAGYTASSGDRYIRGCYTDRAEMRSTYRALVSEGRFKR
ncbi:TauD/TfdA family dioxygenase [Salipiger mucosus]|uniref:Gamma-butyrobetaine,2-oxoglutarate dioxygenase n=1 Tax=Salipiger mucosus DSM 16094 TaxID=1123237 RepID=S9Q9X7_9RHOB|nr:TauD/TfdA family dioxygenase [Salipiger mucosus]EPX76438.1 Gamma-butyrobetaine,2-oxoglutarate dioxygenase [Salipiger mucosus DSM 16094]